MLRLMLALLLTAPVLAEELRLRTAAQDNNHLKYDLKVPAHPGICVEIIRAVEALDPELRFSDWQMPSSLRRIEQQIEVGELDVFCALIRNPTRATRMDFIDVPVYTVRHRIAVRADDPVQIEDFDDIRRLGLDGSILVNRSTAHEEWLRGQGGLQLDASHPDTATNLRKLVARRARLYYHTEAALQHYIEEEGLQAKVRLLPKVFKEEALYFVVTRQLPAAARARLTQALERLSQSGELGRISAGYRE